jgi:hypothetical protein
MLDWDRPLHEQSEPVKALARQYIGDDFEHMALTGQELHHAIAGTNEIGGPLNAEAAAQVLREHGIKGIRYADAQSRNLTPDITVDGARYHLPSSIEGPEASALARVIANEGNVDQTLRELSQTGQHEAQAWLRDNENRIGVVQREATHNVVVFDHNDVEITHRNGEPVEPHAPTPAEVHELQGQEPHGGGDVTELYGDQRRSLEDLENEYRQENAAAAARERAGGGEPGGTSPADQAGVPAGGEPGRGGAGPPGREGALANALRAARGQPTGPDRFSADADASAKLRPPEELKRAQTDIDTQSEFFSRLDPETLSEEFKAELAAIDNIDTEAKGYGDAAMQAGACIARGMAGGAT